jgi:cysteine desulfuration protein SufE
MTVADLVSDFALLDNWEDRYRYVIELGRDLEPIDDNARTDVNKVRGCASQVWLRTSVEPDAYDPTLRFVGDSDAHIVRGLIAILFEVYSGRRASEILALDALDVFRKLGLHEHLTPQRSNGFAAMVGRIRTDAQRALASASAV